VAGAYELEGYEDSVPARQMSANPVRSGRKQR